MDFERMKQNLSDAGCSDAAIPFDYYAKNPASKAGFFSRTKAFQLVDFCEKAPNQQLRNPANQPKLQNSDN